MRILDAEELERKPHVPPGVRTEGKNDAANWIEEEVLNKGRWPMALTQMAEESDWSRQHLRNTLSDYFRPKGVREAIDAEGEPAVIDEDTGSLNIEVPTDCDVESYLRGYLTGYRHRKHEASRKD